MKSTPHELLQFVRQVCSADWEPGLEEYTEHLKKLNAIIRQTGAKMEGGLFVPHLPQQIDDTPAPVFRNKRSNYALFCSSGDTLLEIGFNAGHSALLALTINKDLVYTGVDIFHHAYTKPCYEYLRSVFGPRLKLHYGDSRDVLPVLRDEGKSYELYHVDGGHNFYIAHSDLCNIIDFSTRGGTLLVDDVNDHLISSLCDFYVLRGRLTRLELKTLWQKTRDHELFRINQRLS